jgi:hypothetical protein
MDTSVLEVTAFPAVSAVQVILEATKEVTQADMEVLAEVDMEDLKGEYPTFIII